MERDIERVGPELYALLKQIRDEICRIEDFLLDEMIEILAYMRLWVAISGESSSEKDGGSGRGVGRVDSAESVGVQWKCRRIAKALLRRLQGEWSKLAEEAVDKIMAYATESQSLQRELSRVEEKVKKQQFELAARKKEIQFQCLQAADIDAVSTSFSNELAERSVLEENLQNRLKQKELTISKLEEKLKKLEHSVALKTLQSKGGEEIYHTEKISASGVEWQNLPEEEGSKQKKLTEKPTDGEKVGTSHSAENLRALLKNSQAELKEVKEKVAVKDSIIQSFKTMLTKPAPIFVATSNESFEIVKKQGGIATDNDMPETPLPGASEVSLVSGMPSRAKRTELNGNLSENEATADFPFRASESFPSLAEEMGSRDPIFDITMEPVEYQRRLAKFHRYMMQQEEILTFSTIQIQCTNSDLVLLLNILSQLPHKEGSVDFNSLRLKASLNGETIIKVPNGLSQSSRKLWNQIVCKVPASSEDSLNRTIDGHNVWQLKRKATRTLGSMKSFYYYHYNPPTNAANKLEGTHYLRSQRRFTTMEPLQAAFSGASSPRNSMAPTLFSSLYSRGLQLRDTLQKRLTKDFSSISHIKNIPNILLESSDSISEESGTPRSAISSTPSETNYKETMLHKQLSGIYTSHDSSIATSQWVGRDSQRVRNTFFQDLGNGTIKNGNNFPEESGKALSMETAGPGRGMSATLSSSSASKSHPRLRYSAQRNTYLNAKPDAKPP